jgi:hypothetical protein
VKFSQATIRTEAGASLKIEPRIKSTGPALLRWSKDGAALPSNVLVHESGLFIPQVSRENEGVYEVQIQDNVGNARSSVNVVVVAQARPSKPNIRFFCSS